MGSPEPPDPEIAFVYPRRLPPSLERLLLPNPLGLDAARRHAALTTVFFGFSMALWAAVFMLVYLWLGSARCALIVLGACAALVVNSLALRLHGLLRVTSNLVAGIVLVTLLSLSLYSGGFRSPAVLWLPSVPMIAILLSGWRTGLLWLLATVAAAWTVFLLDWHGALPASDFQGDRARWLGILGLVGFIACVSLLSFLFDAIAGALRRRLEAARKQAVEANRSKSAFLARMSHEIRTPMNGVLGMLELLGNTDVTGRQKEYTRFARQSAESLLRILNDILDFSKIEVGRLEIESIPFDLREIVGDTLQALAADAEAKNLELACHIHPDVPSGLEGDPGRLRQILVNLVGNAVKFTETGEVVVTIARTGTEDSPTSLEFRVRDTGIGIPADKHDLVWDVFGQADTSTTRRFGGTGLGLNISRQLVRMMGGCLDFESEEGKGTTFFFTLAFDVVGSVLPQAVIPHTPLDGVRVLIVDDNATNRFVLEEVLGSWSVAVTSVDGARPALAALQQGKADTPPYQVVLLDVMMPDTDGLMLAEQIREDPDLADVPLLILSSAHSAESRARCEALGIVGQLRKPVKQSELLDALLLALHPVLAARTETAQLDATHREGPSARVLLAEDGLVNRRVVIGLLEEQGHVVIAVEDGREAVTTWENDEGTFDLILMDLEMPNLDGLEATRYIRAKEKERGDGAHIPIVALTAHAILDYKERCIEAGMDAHLAKPLDAERLYALIREMT